MNLKRRQFLVAGLARPALATQKQAAALEIDVAGMMSKAAVRGDVDTHFFQPAHTGGPQQD